MQALRYIWVTLKLLGRSDIPRLAVLATKFSRLLKLKILRRWFFTDLDRAAWDKLRGPHSGGLKIGVTRVGTLGDKVGLMLFVDGLRRAYPGALILVFDWDINAKYFEMFRDQDLIDGLYFGHGLIADDLVRLVVDRKMVDLFLDHRYVVKAIDTTDQAARHPRVTKAHQAFPPFAPHFDRSPHRLDRLSAEFLNMTGHQITAQTAAVDLDLDGYRLPLSDADLEPRRGLGGGRYVTIHHGAGPTAYGAADRQTKMWFVERWAAVVEKIKAQGLAVYQLGGPNEPVIAGADPRFLGTTNFHQSCGLLQGAEFHLDTEGGLVHMANIVGTRSIVLFGPTPASFFDYRRNLNISRGACNNCWWSHQKWQTECRLGRSTPACMDAIIVDDVMAAAQLMIDGDAGAIDAARAAGPPPANTFWE